MNYPKISIVTPVFNQVNYIEQTIMSVLNQGYPNLEYIIIDGASTDGTIDIIKKYDSQITCWISEPDNGMYDALQKGLNMCSGEIMGWINADDTYYSRCLFVLANVFVNNPQVEWVTGMQTTIDEDGMILRNEEGRFLSKYNFYMKDFQWIAQESTLWRRSLWEKCGGTLDVRLRYAGDFELWLRFFRYAPLFHVQSPIGTYRVRHGQLSGSIEKYMYEVDMIYNELVINKSDLRICKRYKSKKSISNIIGKFRILNGDKIVRLRSFEKKYFPNLKIQWDGESRFVIVS